jgi:hypothetical protein
MLDDGRLPVAFAGSLVDMGQPPEDPRETHDAPADPDPSTTAAAQAAANAPVPEVPPLPEVDSPPPEKILEDVPDPDEVIENAQSVEEILEQQPGVDELLGSRRKKS